MAEQMTRFLQLCLLHFCASTADGFLCYSLNRCVFASSRLSDMEYSYSLVYNKLEVVRFNSSVGRFVGFTEFGVKRAEAWNRNPAVLGVRRNEKKRYCLHNVRVDYESSLSRSVRPTVRLHSEAPPAGHHSAMLVCSVYSFYPRQIRVTWSRNEREVTEGVTSTTELADADWFYQIHSHLEYTPRPGDRISCVVDHVSLEEPLHMDWDESMSDGKEPPVVMAASGLTVGLLLSFLFCSLFHLTRKNTQKLEAQEEQNGNRPV